MPKFNAGDKVIISNCAEAELYKGQVFTCRADSYFESGTERVFLEEKTGFWNGDCLQKISQCCKKEITMASVCSECGRCYCRECKCKFCGYICYPDFCCCEECDTCGHASKKQKLKYDPSSEDTYKIAEEMMVKGGSFVSRLGDLFMRGDFENRTKIVKTWENYFDDYAYVLNRGKFGFPGV